MLDLSKVVHFWRIQHAATSFIVSLSNIGFKCMDDIMNLFNFFSGILLVTKQSDQWILIKEMQKMKNKSEKWYSKLFLLRNLSYVCEGYYLSLDYLLSFFQLFKLGPVESLCVSEANKEVWFRAQKVVLQCDNVGLINCFLPANKFCILLTPVRISSDGCLTFCLCWLF